MAKEQCTGLEIDGRRIRVDYSITQRPHTPTPGIYMGRPTMYVTFLFLKYFYVSNLMTKFAELVDAMIAATNMNVVAEEVVVVVIEITATVVHPLPTSKRTIIVLMIVAEAMIAHAHDPTHLVSDRF